MKLFGKYSLQVYLRATVWNSAATLRMFTQWNTAAASICWGVHEEHPNHRWVLHCWAGRLLPIKESHWILLVVCTPIISHWYKCFSRHSHLRHERWLVVLFPLGGWKTQEPWSRGLVHLSSPPVEQDIAPTYPTYHWGYTPLTKLLWPNKQ